MNTKVIFEMDKIVSYRNNNRNKKKTNTDGKPAVSPQKEKKNKQL